MRWVSSSPSHHHDHVPRSMLMLTSSCPCSCSCSCSCSCHIRCDNRKREATRRATSRFWVAYPNELLRLEGVSLAGTISQTATETQPSELFIQAISQQCLVLPLFSCISQLSRLSSSVCSETMAGGAVVMVVEPPSRKYILTFVERYTYTLHSGVLNPIN